MNAVFGTMQYVLGIAFLLSFAASMVFGFGFGVWFDRWLENLYRDRPEEWVKLGRPLGRFWTPANSLSMYLRSYYARSMLLARFSQVGGPEPSPEYYRALWWWRRHTFCGGMAFAILVLVIARLILNR